jgi:hypothetical protein
MMKRFGAMWVVWSLVSLLFTGCTLATIPPTATPMVLPMEVPAGGMVFTPLDPSGTPEANPVLLVNGTVVDSMTGQPISADVYIVESGGYREPTTSEQVLAGSQDFEITLLDELDGWLVVKAEGYETWKLRLRYHIQTSRRLGGPIQLIPLPKPGQLM